MIPNHPMLRLGLIALLLLVAFMVVRVAVALLSKVIYIAIVTVLTFALAGFVYRWLSHRGSHDDIE